jgi:hypothetical protein
MQSMEPRKMEITPEQRQEWEKEFDAAAKRSLRERMRYSFIYTYKPGMDDPPYYRSFDTMEDYRNAGELIFLAFALPAPNVFLGNFGRTC